MRCKRGDFLRVVYASSAQALNDNQQSFLYEILEQADIAAGAASQDHAQTGLKLANEFTFGGDITFANTARQFAAWNEIHTL